MATTAMRSDAVLRLAWGGYGRIIPATAAIGASLGGLCGAIAATIGRAQPTDGQLRWYPLALALGGLLGIGGGWLGGRFAGGRARAANNALTLAGSIAGLLVATVAWSVLVARAQAPGGEWPTVVRDTLMAAGGGGLAGGEFGFLLGAALGLVAGGLIAGAGAAIDRLSPARSYRAVATQRTLVTAIAAAGTVALTLALPALRTSPPALHWLGPAPGGYVPAFFLLSRLLLGTYVAYAAAQLAR